MKGAVLSVVEEEEGSGGRVEGESKPLDIGRTGEVFEAEVEEVRL